MSEQIAGMVVVVVVVYVGVCCEVGGECGGGECGGGHSQDDVPSLLSELACLSRYIYILWPFRI